MGGRDHGPVGEPGSPGHGCLAVTLLTANGSPGDGRKLFRAGEAVLSRQSIGSHWHRTPARCLSGIVRLCAKVALFHPIDLCKHAL